jgi:tetratricopeptide (TPR) repeat protein
VPKISFFVFLLLVLASFRSQAQNTEEKAFADSLNLLKQKQYAQSAHVLISLAKEHPEKSVYWFNLGVCAFQLNKYEIALKAYGKVIELNSPLAPAARLYRAKVYKATGRSMDASKELETLINSDAPPGIAAQAKKDLEELTATSDVEENALADYQQGNFEKAEAELKSLSESQLSLNGELLLGLTELRESKFFEASKVFSALLLRPNLSEEQRSTLRDLQKKSRHSESERSPYWLSADVSAGLTDNAYTDPSSSSATASSLTRIQAGLGYHFNSTQAWSQKLGYSYFSENPPKAPEMRNETQSLSAALLYSKKDTDFSLTPYFEMISWNAVSASKKSGLNVKWIETWGYYEAALEGDASSQAAVSSDYDYLSGPSSWLRPSAAWWDQNLYVQLSWTVGTDGSQDINYSNGSLLPMKNSYQGPGIKIIWRPSASFVTTASYSSLQRKYQTSSLPTLKVRQDEEQIFNLKFSYYLTPQFSIYEQNEWTQNQSTLSTSDVADKNYKVFILTAGLNWSLF